MFSEWLEIGSMKQLKKKSLQPCIQGVNARATLEKILGFQEWLLEAVFLGSQCRTLDVHISITGDCMKS